jgi:hypothetical protein
MKVKSCPACPRGTQPKPVTEFGRNAQSPDGLHYYCRACSAAKARSWNEQNRDKVKQTKLRYLQKLAKRNANRDPYGTLDEPTIAGAMA